MDSKHEEVKRLNVAIDSIDNIGNSEWLSTLNERKYAELDFHNKDRDDQSSQEREDPDFYEKYYGNRKYYETNKRSRDYMKDWIARESNGNVFLDFACGNGGNALDAAKAGAAISLGFDISDVSVKNCRKFAAEAKLTNTRFFQADAENTKLPDNCIDSMICSGMLHHLDLSYAFPEIRRILKPGGKVLCFEALNYNPFIKLYRYITPAMRTDWEKHHILSLKDVAFARRFFSVADIRYWHVTGYAGGKFPILFPMLDSLDRILEITPFINRMAWIFSFVLEKRVED